MFNLRSFFAVAFVLSLVSITSPALAQGGGPTPLDPSSSSLTQEEDPPPPDDGDKDFDEVNTDVLNQTSPSTAAPSSPGRTEPSGTPMGWLEWLWSWLAAETQ